jgi:hypothetical protein
MTLLALVLVRHSLALQSADSDRRLLFVLRRKQGQSQHSLRLPALKAHLPQSSEHLLKILAYKPPEQLVGRWHHN